MDARQVRDIFEGSSERSDPCRSRGWITAVVRFDLRRGFSTAGRTDPEECLFELPQRPSGFGRAERARVDRAEVDPGEPRQLGSHRPSGAWWRNAAAWNPPAAAG